MMNRLPYMPISDPDSAHPAEFPSQILRSEGLTVVSNTPKVYENYKSRRVCVCGIIQVLGGVASVILKITAIALLSSAHGGSPTFIGHGIWGGILFVVSGGVSIGASRKRSKCLVISSMVLSIIAASAAASGVIIGLVIGAYSINHRYVCNPEHYHDSDRELFASKCYTMKVDGILNVVIAIILTITAIAAIVASTFGCKVTCCGTSDSQVIVVPVYYAKDADGTQVLMLGDNQHAIPGLQSALTSQSKGAVDNRYSPSNNF